LPRIAGSARGHALWLGALVLLAAALRLHGWDWGRPDFFEEATPIKQAWKLWAWPPTIPFDGNPHFFRYPSLVIYLHFALQAVLFAALRAVGAVHSAADFQVLYATSPVPFFLAGRLLAVAFGVGAAWMTARLGARALGPAAGVVAGAFLAVNAFHVDLSQVIAVDGPLTFFVAWALLRIVRLTESMTLSGAIAAGAAIGLATSCKYTGAFLVVPLVVAWWITRGPDGRRHVPVLLAGLGAAAVAFALTSPFVLLDFRAAWSDISAEREHMAVGHFGLARGPSWDQYLGALRARILGWPGLVAAVAGAAIALARRRPWAIVTASFAAVYAGVVGSWSMSADYYLLPLTPALMLFAAAAVAEVARYAEGRRVPGGPRAALALAAFVVAAPFALRLPEAYAKARPDTRRLAREFIERTMPAGSLIVTEHHGPQLRNLEATFKLPNEIRTRVRDDPDAGPLYHVLFLTMDQTHPEVSAPYYDLRLYRDADAFVLTGDVGDRYAAEPERFAPQLAFYRDIETACDRVADFVPEGPGTRITIWRYGDGRRPFARRRAVKGPVPLSDPEAAETNRASQFYFWVGLAYEAAGFPAEAERAYGIGLRARYFDPGTYANLAVGAARCLLATGQPRRADAILQRAVKATPWASDRASIEQFRAMIARR
jgi:hypothetical protein